MNTLDSTFMEMKSFHFSNSQKIKGFLTIGKIQRPTMYLKIGWELFTTFIIYSPGITNYLQELIPSVRRKWNTLSDKERYNVIAALTQMNRHGAIERAMNIY